MKDNRETVEVVKRNWRAEVETAQVYRELAGRETDEKRKGILNRMAEAEERHAERWAKKLADLGEPVPTIPDSLGRKLQRWELRSRFDEWKPPKKNMKPPFAINGSVFWRRNMT